jgi:hypothetical protein
MMKYISRHLNEVHNLTWNPQEHHIGCLNHVINLAVQDFLRGIKGLAVDNESDDYLRDEEDDESEEQPEGFAGTLWKIRSITKVCAI